MARPLPKCGTCAETASVGSGSEAQMDDFRLEFSVRAYGEQADGDWQLESSRAAGAGIEVEHAFLCGEIRYVRVAGEHCCKLCRCGVQMEGLHVVHHI